MVRYVPIEETVILIMCFCESYEKNTQHKRQIGRCNCILSKKNIKLQPVPPLIPLEALFIRYIFLAQIWHVAPLSV